MLWKFSLRLGSYTPFHTSELLCLTNPATTTVLAEIFKSSFLLHMIFCEICKNLAEMSTLLSLTYIRQWDQMLPSANLCSTSCSVSHTHAQKKNQTKKTLITVYARNKLNGFLLHKYILDYSKSLSHRSTRVLLFFTKQVGFLWQDCIFPLFFVLPSGKVGRSRVFECHYIVNNNGIYLLILTLPLILSM